MSEGVKRIATERQRQIDVEGWTPDHDDEHGGGEMAWAAVAYAAPGAIYRSSGFRDLRHARGGGEISFIDPWPWDRGWDKRTKHAPNRLQRIRDLEKAGALIAAELDRLLRAEADDPTEGITGDDDDQG